MSVQPSLNVASGGVSIHEGLVPYSDGTLSAGVPAAGAYLAWDETSEAQANGFCGQPREAGGVCHARPIKDDSQGRCYGHSRGDHTAEATTTNAEA